MKHGRLILAAFFIILSGCEKKATSQENTAAQQPKGKVVIEMGDVKITDADIREEIASLPAELKTFVGTKDGKKEFIESVAKREMLYKEALAKGIDADPKIKNDLEKLKKRLVVDSFLRTVIKTDDKVDDTQLNEYYKKNQKHFEQPEKTHSKHILVKDKKLADEIHGKLKKDPAQFEKLAEEHSIDSSAKQGGDIGAHEKGTLVPEFEKALDKLKKPGDISPVVKSQFGFHVIKLVSREKAQVQKLEDVKDEVKQAYLRENQKTTFENLVGELKKKYNIKINEDALESTGNDTKK